MAGVGTRRRGRGRSAVEWTACGSEELARKPMMRHYSAMLLQGLSRKPEALFIISFFFSPSLFFTAPRWPSVHCTASWFTISQGKGGPPLLMTLSLSLSLRLREAAVSSRFTAGSQGHCVMPHNKEHLKTAKAFGKSHCLSSPWAYAFKYLILMTTHFSMPLYSSSLNKQTFFFSPQTSWATWCAILLALNASTLHSL